MNKDIINATKHILMQIKKVSEEGLTDTNKENLKEELIYIRDLISSFDYSVLNEYYYFLINLNNNVSIFTEEQKIILEYFINNISKYINSKEEQMNITIEDIVREQEEDMQEQIKFYKELDKQKKEKKLCKR